MHEPVTANGGPDHLQSLVHELRQSLGAIVVLAGAAKRYDDVPEDVRRVLLLIESEVEAAAAVCRRMTAEA